MKPVLRGNHGNEDAPLAKKRCRRPLKPWPEAGGGQTNILTRRSTQKTALSAENSKHTHIHTQQMEGGRERERE